MKFKVKKLICSENKEKAVKGKEYYFFNDVAVIIEAFREGTADRYKGELAYSVDECDTYPYCFYKLEEAGETVPCKFIYPVSNKESEEPAVESSNDRYLTYEEMKVMWLTNPSRLYKYQDFIFTIFTCNDHRKAFISDCCNIIFEGPILQSWDVNIKDITDINNKPFTISEYPKYNLQNF